MAQKTWEARDFSAGYIDSVDDHLLPPNATGDCSNVICREAGLLTTRRGQARLNSSELAATIQNLHPFYYGSSRKLLVAAGGTVYAWNPVTSAMDAVQTGFNAAADMHFCTAVNKVILMNGVDAPKKYDGATVSALANAPADGMYPAFHQAKVICRKKSDPDTIYMSDEFDPETWPGVNLWKFGYGDGDEITSIYSHLSDLIVFKRRSAHRLAGTTMDDFYYRILDSRQGATGPRAVAPYGIYLFFVSEDGLCVWNGTGTINISKEILPGLWGQVNQAYLSKAVVFVWDNLIWFALPEGTATANNLVVVFDPQTGAASTGKFWPWRQLNISCAATYNDGSAQLKLYTGDNADGFVNQQGVGWDDFGADISAYIDLPVLSHGNAERRIMARFAAIQDSPGANDMTMQAAFDYGTLGDMVIDTTSDLSRTFWYRDNFLGRYVKHRLSYSGKAGAQLRGVKVWYDPITEGGPG